MSSGHVMYNTGCPGDVDLPEKPRMDWYWCVIRALIKFKIGLPKGIKRHDPHHKHVAKTERRQSRNNDKPFSPNVLQQLHPAAFGLLLSQQHSTEQVRPRGMDSRSAPI